jgi:enterobactin synthetase component F
VAEAIVVARRDSDGTILLTAYIVAARGVMVDIGSVRSLLTGRLPNHMIPATIMVLDAMPLTPNGKLDRKALPLPERISGRTYDEPSTSIERSLAVLWQQILKVERVGLHDNFFELGGDSLSAAEMIACFPEHFKLELPLSSLFEAPTIAGLTVLVERIGSENVDPLGVVLPLRQPAHRPLFCVHPMAGLSLGFSSLLRHLDSTMPVYGLQSRGLRGGILPSSIEEIAADYLEQIRRIQPVGPYRLLGRSLGGLIGHCIARQMQEQNLKVELLAMIDSSLFHSGVRPLTEAEEVLAALGFLDIRLEEEIVPRTLRQLGAFLLHPDNAHMIPAAHQAMMRVTEGIMKGSPDFIEKLIAVMLNHLKLARRYRPEKVDVSLLYFHATETTGDVNGIIDREPSAWRPFIRGKIEVHELECHHEAVFDPVPAAQIGRILQQRLSSLEDSRTLDIPRLLREGGEMTATYA